MTQSSPEQVAAWLGVALFAAFLVAFSYYAWLGYQYLSRRLDERGRWIPGRCVCGHGDNVHLELLRSCMHGLCPCRRYTPEPAPEVQEPVRPSQR